MKVRLTSVQEDALRFHTDVPGFVKKTDGRRPLPLDHCPGQRYLRQPLPGHAARLVSERARREP